MSPAVQTSIAASTQMVRAVPRFSALADPDPANLSGCTMLALCLNTSADVEMTERRTLAVVGKAEIFGRVSVICSEDFDDGRPTSAHQSQISLS